MTTSSCRRCSLAFSPRSTGGRAQLYCNARCRAAMMGDPTGKQHVDTPANLNGGREALCENCCQSFRTRLRGGGRRQRYCSAQCGGAAYYKSNPTKGRDHMLRRNYGMSQQAYLLLLEQQQGVCKICNKPPANNMLSVDHCHSTGVVRGLLCAPCNRHVGYFEKFGPAIQDYLKAAKPNGFSTEASIARVDVQPPETCTECGYAGFAGSVKTASTKFHRCGCSILLAACK